MRRIRRKPSRVAARWKRPSTPGVKRTPDGAIPVGPATDDAPTGDDELQTAHGWTGGQHWSATAVRTSTWIAVACGPAALVGVLGAGASTPTAVQASAPADATANERAAVGEFAQRVVTTWAQTTDENVGELQKLASTPDAIVWPHNKPATTSDPAVSGLKELNDGLWSVTVAVDLNPADKGSTTRQFFQVPVVYSAGDLTATALPSPVQGPAAAKAPDLDYSNNVDPTSSAGRTVVDFLSASLTGSGELGRYITPGVSIRAISPAPYTGVSVVALTSTEDLLSAGAHDKPEDGQQVHVSVTATGELESGADVPLQYALTLRGRDGRWEVAEIDPAPRLTENSTADLSSTR